MFDTYYLTIKTITKLLQNYRKTITNDYKTITKIFFTQLK